MDVTSSAQYGADRGTPSQHLLSSDMDRAHRVGLWAKAHQIVPLEVKTGRGHKMILNRDYQFDFANDEKNPVVTKTAR